MRDKLLLILVLFLFFVACVVLNMRQSDLLSRASENFVNAYYVEPQNKDNNSFIVENASSQPRDVILTYQLADTKEITQSVTLEPREKKLFAPAELPVTTTVRYQDVYHQEQTLTLYKK